jgi:hypothetical protein
MPEGSAALGRREQLDAGAEVLAGLGLLADDEGLAGVDGPGDEGAVDAVQLEADALTGLGAVGLVMGDLDVLDADLHGVAVAEQDELVLAGDDAAAQATLDDHVARELRAVEGAVDVEQRRAGGVVGGDGEVDLEGLDEVADAGLPRRAGALHEHGEGGAAEDAGAVAVEAEAVEQVADVALDEVDPLEVLDEVALVMKTTSWRTPRARARSRCSRVCGWIESSAETTRIAASARACARAAFLSHGRWPGQSMWMKERCSVL